MTNTHTNGKDPLGQPMLKSRLEMPFSDFEEAVMQRMQEESIRKQVGARDRYLSFFFFLSGSVLGIAINFFLQKTPIHFFNVPTETILLVFQSAFVLLFLVQLEKNIPLIRQCKKTVQRR